jgi:hypothetical protein
MKKFLLGFITGTALAIAFVILVVNKLVKLFGKFIELTGTIDEFKTWLSDAIYYAMYGRPVYKPRRDYAKFYSRRKERDYE